MCPRVNTSSAYPSHTLKQSVTWCHQGGKWKHLFLWEPFDDAGENTQTALNKCQDTHTCSVCLHHTDTPYQQFQPRCVHLCKTIPPVCVCVCVHERDRGKQRGREKKERHVCQIQDQMAKCQWIPHQHDCSLTESVARQNHPLIQWAMSWGLCTERGFWGFA